MVNMFRFLINYASQLQCNSLEYVSKRYVYVVYDYFVFRHFWAGACIDVYLSKLTTFSTIDVVLRVKCSLEMVEKPNRWYHSHEMYSAGQQKAYLRGPVSIAWWRGNNIAIIIFWPNRVQQDNETYQLPTSFMVNFSATKHLFLLKLPDKDSDCGCSFWSKTRQIVTNVLAAASSASHQPLYSHRHFPIHYRYGLEGNWNMLDLFFLYLFVSSTACYFVFLCFRRFFFFFGVVWLCICST